MGLWMTLAGIVFLGSICGFVAIVIAYMVKNDQQRLSARVQGLTNTLEKLQERQEAFESTSRIPSPAGPEAREITAVPKVERRIEEEVAVPSALPTAVKVEAGSVAQPAADNNIPETVYVLKELLKKSRPPEPVTLESAPFAPDEYGSRKEKERIAFWSDFEARVGKRWMTWLGGLLLIVSAGLFIKYAVDRQWMGPAQRVILAIAVGIVLLVLGGMAAKRKMRALGLGLTGTGLAILYTALYGAGVHFELVPRPMAFGGMVLVTITGMGLAVLHDAMAIAVLAVLGGFLTPVMLSTGEDARDALFGYLLLLDLGVLGAALFRRWRVLDILGFAGTMALYLAWYEKFYTPDVMMPALLWLGAFFLVFLIVPFAHALRTGKRLTVERFLQAPANGLVTFAFAYDMLEGEYRYTLAVIALCLAACYAGLAAAVRLRIPEDRAGMFGCVGLSVFFLTVAAPLRLGMNGVLLAWSVEAPMLAYLGYIFRYRILRLGGLIVLMLASYKLFGELLAIHDEPFRLLLNIQFASAMCIPIGAFVFAAIPYKLREYESIWGSAVSTLAGIAGGVIGLVLLNVEFHEYITGISGQTRTWINLHSIAAGTIIWSAGAVLFALAARTWKSKGAGAFSLLTLLVSMVFVVMLQIVDMPHTFLPFLNLRCLASLCVPAASFLCAWIGWRRDDANALDETYMPAFYGITGGLAAMALLHVEVHAFFSGHAAQWGYKSTLYGMAAGTIIWALGAAAFSFAGRRLKSSSSLSAGAVAAGVTMIMTILMYSERLEQFIPVLNPRCLAALGGVAATMLYAAILSKQRDDSGRSGIMTLFIGLMYLLGVLSAEVLFAAPAWIEDSTKARWVGQMSLSVLWGVYATFLLWIGFARHVRALRFAGLALFGIAAVKLAIVDLSWLGQIYRIVSFVALGVLMIGVSYAYHRLERLLTQESGGG